MLSCNCCVIKMTFIYVGYYNIKLLLYIYTLLDDDGDDDDYYYFMYARTGSRYMDQVK